MASFICRDTGDSYPLTEIRWQSDSKGLLDITSQLLFDPERVRALSPDLWRYRSSFPLDNKSIPVSFGEGMTPLKSVSIGGKDVLMKLDFLFPSGSYKDRGASVMITQAKALGVKRVVQDSSGNAGCAVAMYCALAGIECEIFVPADTSPSKLVQIAAYGAKLTLVPGSREDTAAAAMKAAAQTFYASHVWNPFFFQGTKTFAYEVCEQMGWKAPDSVVLPAGNGTLVLGVYIGFQELKSAGIISHVPKIIAIQAANCAPLYAPFHNGKSDFSAVKGSPTYAEGIAIAFPQRGTQMMEYIRATGGTILRVEENEIQQSLTDMCKKGYFIEPTSAAVVAGVEQYIRDHAQAGEKIVSVFTGHGLKSAQKIGKLLHIDT